MKTLKLCMCVVSVLFSINCGGKATNAGAAHDTKISPALKEISETDQNSFPVRSEIVGTWLFREVHSHPDYDVNAVEDKIFHFFKDGRTKVVERKKGKSHQYMIEDWEFLSEGTYRITGDTIYCNITRFVAVRQNFKRLKKVNGQKVWVDSSIPTFDSLITDGSEDRFITLEELKRDFKKIK